jgi:hypothetical protein
VKLPNWIDDAVDKRKLPPWSDDRAMGLWLEELLLDIMEADMVAEKLDQNHALKAAKCGLIQPLRNLYPDIAEFINLPKRGRGKRFPPMPDSNPITTAALDAKRIWELWKRFYPGRRRRRGKTAEWFAAQLWTGADGRNGEPVEITEDMVKNRLKKKLPSSK